jgi:hypothetical protein
VEAVYSFWDTPFYDTHVVSFDTISFAMSYDLDSILASAFPGNIQRLLSRSTWALLGNLDDFHMGVTMAVLDFHHIASDAF